MDHLDEASSQVIKFHQKIFILILFLFYVSHLYYNPLFSILCNGIFVLQSTLLSLFFYFILSTILLIMLQLISNLFTPSRNDLRIINLNYKTYCAFCSGYKIIITQNYLTTLAPSLKI